MEEALQQRRLAERVMRASAQSMPRLDAVMDPSSALSALQVVCILYVGMQLLLPGQDAGIDFAREYELAKDEMNMQKLHRSVVVVMENRWRLRVGCCRKT